MNMKSILHAVFGLNYLIAKPVNTRTLVLTEKEIEMARITPLSSGKFAIVNDGEVIATYARQRDARRGAARRGLAVA